MTRYTSFLGLSALGAGDDPTEDGHKFFGQDRDDIDSAIRRALLHRHTGVADNVDTPVTAPTLELDTGLGGVLRAGQRIYYRYSLIDEYGTESVASPVAFIDTPAALTTPAAPSGISYLTSGGTLLPGSYYYRLSAYDGANTIETRSSDPAHVIVPAGSSTNQVTFTLPSLPAGADGFNVYRRKPGGDFAYLTSIDMQVATPPTDFTDDGSIVDDCVRRLPSGNLTAGSNAVVVTLPGATPTVPEGHSWRLYRSYDSLTWVNTLLATIVEETSEGSGIITPEYTDLGIGASVGQPRTTTPNFQAPEKINFDDGSEIQGVLPPAHLLGDQVIEFRFPGPVEVQEGTEVWTCPWERAYIREVVVSLGRDSTPASTSVIADVDKYDSQIATPSWTTIFTNQANRPAIAVGENDNIDSPATPDVRQLYRGDKLSPNIEQAGGGATPTDTDLVVQIVLWTYDSTATTVDVFN